MCLICTVVPKAFLKVNHEIGYGSVGHGIEVFFSKAQPCANYTSSDLVRRGERVLVCPKVWPRIHISADKLINNWPARSGYIYLCVTAHATRNRTPRIKTKLDLS